ncbi:ABC transporter permease [Corynebacterium guangdongense]|uniref:Peptide/nickel transport system permease protein n=1 Tax=Corynebacterium guangdongense TaxID=1783348 RepID=A0ABU1ZZ21_9CORY|nr:ABC transporter permease [Corynebacterium guangdongense]MDR7330005.1 peptide/nickel transport system permease protein [Corynebacterium guangdongense]WJZ18563.1 Glutathione transport system permease protein GsiD [Corynebacterium guangdongense]
MSRLKRLPLTGWLGLAIVALVVLTAALSLAWTPYDPVHAVPEQRLLGSSAGHPMGTDRYGRDVLSRIMAGARITLAVGVVAVGISALAGTVLGVWAGMARGWPETLIMRGADILLAFPALLLAIVAGAAFGASTTTAMIAIGVAGVPGFARVARAGTLQVMTQDYISAARVSNVPGVLIAWRHVLPNIMGLLIVQSTVAFALAVLAEAALSFLGLGTAPPDPSWGRMLQSAQASLGTAPQLAFWPGLAIAATVLGFNLLGDGLRDVLDPRHSRRSRA